MLFDRFDNMRSKNISDGFDLSKIGVTVTVQAQNSIAKGQKWQGVKNTSASLSLQENTIPSLHNASPIDLSYTFTKSYLNFVSTTHLFNIYFFDVINNVYSNYAVDLQSILDNFGVDSSKSYSWEANCNEDGTLIVLTWLQSQDSSGSFGGANKIIILEVDKENKTATPYVFTLPFTFKRVNANTLISNNNIFLRDYVSSSDYRLRYYKYDIDTHSLSHVYSAFWNTTVQDNFFNFSSFVAKDNILLINGGNRLIKIVMYDSSYSFTYASMQSPFLYLLGLDNNMNYIIGASASDSSNATLYIVPLNISDLSFGTPISLTGVRTSTRAFMYNNRILMYNKIYSFDGSNITEILTSTNTNMSEITSPFWDAKKWAYFNNLNNTSNTIFIILDSSGEYLIEPFTEIETNPNKYYGIASNNIPLGDNSTAQLLFNSL